VERRLIELLGPHWLRSWHTAAAAMIRSAPDLRLWLRQKIDGNRSKVWSASSWPACCRPKPTPTLKSPGYTHLQAGPASLPGPPPDGLLEMAERDATEAGRRAPAG